MTATLTITPQTDGILSIELTDDAGGAIVAGTVVADVYSPKGVKVGDAVTLTHAGGGIWQFDVLAAWSEASGKAVVGEYVAHVVATSAGKQVTDKIRYVVDFTDKD